MFTGVELTESGGSSMHFTPPALSLSLKPVVRARHVLPFST